MNRSWCCLGCDLKGAPWNNVLDGAQFPHGKGHSWGKYLCTLAVNKFNVVLQRLHVAMRPNATINVATCFKIFTSADTFCRKLDMAETTRQNQGGCRGVMGCSSVKMRQFTSITHIREMSSCSSWRRNSNQFLYHPFLCGHFDSIIGNYLSNTHTQYIQG